MPPGKNVAVRIRPKTQHDGTSVRAKSGLSVFTSVDGTLLDEVTFDAGPARAVVREVRAADIPVVPITVMTLDEIAPVAASLELDRTMVIEAGGAIARRKDDEWVVEPCGPPAETLLDVVREIEERSGASLLVYSALPTADAARYSGRRGAMLDASIRRCFSEPLIIEDGDMGEVARVADALGFTLRRGRRFLHLCRQCDEGEAFTRVREEIGCRTAIAVGGASVDFEFMARADIAIIIPGRDGQPDADLARRLPQATIAPAAGPAGWGLAVSAAVAQYMAVASRAEEA